MRDVLKCVRTCTHEREGMEGKGVGREELTFFRLVSLEISETILFAVTSFAQNLLSYVTFLYGAFSHSSS